MQVYLVGGAVRDELLRLPVHERDYVVVGATPQQMERAGYRPVGRDFPVFLHPDTRQEYALARLERKTGPGYRGFVTYFAPDVTLEQDLQRRDLTVNAMARSEDGRLIDPYGGERDLEARILRHVSPAFVEDPVRILRLARFGARFASLGFVVAPETSELMRDMVRNGEVDALVPERVWRETERALAESKPETFFDILSSCGALTAVMPQLLWSDTERKVLRDAAALSTEPAVRFAALLAPSSPRDIDQLCERLRAPADYRELARLASMLVARFAAGAAAPTADELLNLFEKGDAFRRRDRFERAVLAARAQVAIVPERLARALSAAGGATLSAQARSELKGPQIAQALRASRVAALQSLLGSE